MAIFSMLYISLLLKKSVSNPLVEIKGNLKFGINSTARLSTILKLLLCHERHPT